MRKQYEAIKVWKKHNGAIPKDENGISFDIHHIDGNPENNDINNLIALSLKDHYEIHKKQDDWKACKALSIRLKEGITSEERSELSRKIHTGKKRSKETCDKISKSQKGKTLSEDHKKKIGDANRGKKRLYISEEHRINLSKAQKGKKRKPMSEEAKRKISEYQKSKIFTEDHRANLSKALTGKKRSIESIEKQKRSLAAKKKIY